MHPYSQSDASMKAGSKGETLVSIELPPWRKGPIRDRLVSSPRDMPHLRLTMLDRWKPGQFYSWAHANYEQRRGVQAGGKAFDPIALRHAQLWYVTPEMSKLVAHAAEDLPPTTLCDDLVPSHSPYGLVAWGEPMSGTDVVHGGNIDVSLNLWGRTYLVDDRIMIMADGKAPAASLRYDERSLSIGSYRYEEAGAASAYLPAGTSDWRWDTETHDPLDPRIDPVVTMSASEERRWLAALWLLAAQPLSSDRSEPAERHTRKRSDKRSVSSDVRVIDLRAPKRAPSEGESERAVEWRQRWIVEGHWRQQACGPGWSQHRPVYIHDFVKGPADKPLKLRDDVRVVRSGDERAR